MAEVGGRSGPTVPPAEAGGTRRAETEWRSRRRRLAARRGGLQGSDAHLRQCACRRHNAAAPPRGDLSKCSAQALPGSRREPTKEHSRIRTAGAAACARACGPAAAAPPGRIECAARKRRRCDLWRLRRRPAVCASVDPRVPLRPAPAGLTRQPIVIRMDRDAQRLGDASAA